MLANDYSTDYIRNLTDFSEENISFTKTCKTIAVIIWSILVFTGISGNSMVIFTIIKTRKLKNVTQCYLVNLAISDTSFIISCIPFTSLTYLINGWIFGSLFCKISQYFTFVTVCASCLSLMMMTIDRYIYICNIQKVKWRNPFYVLKTSIVIWLISFLLSIPIFMNHDVLIQDYNDPINSTHFKVNSIEECVQRPDNFWSNNFIHWYTTVISYIIPSIVLIICYFRIIVFMTKNNKNLVELSRVNKKMSIHKKKKVTKTVVTLIFIFIVLWFPVHFLATWYRIDENFPEGNVVFVIKLVAHTMSYSISTINPIIYAGFFNKQLRVPMRFGSTFIKTNNNAQTINLAQNATQTFSNYNVSSTRLANIKQNSIITAL